MKLIQALEAQLAVLDDKGLRRVLRSVGSPCGAELSVDGQTVLAFASNDYLGLASHPTLAQAMHAGVDRYGVGSGASHLISGHYAVHGELEQRLAAMQDAHIPDVRALYFGTGYMANLAVLTALAGSVALPDCCIFSESLNHASIIDGARLSRAQVQVFPHADVVALQRMLETSSAPLKIVVTDGVFSMDGDLAPLARMLALCEQYQAWLIVDDAHGFGVLGADGHGILQHLNLRSPNLIYMGTLGKAAGVSGAFVAAHSVLIEWLVQRARQYIYTTAAAPALAQALLASLDIIEGPEGRERRAHLQALVAQWQQGIHGRCWQRLPSNTAIQPLIVGSNHDVMALAAALRARGLWVPAIRPPTVPAGTARLRVTLTSAHSQSQVQRLIDTINELETAHLAQQERENLR